MRISKIEESISNGTGIRLILWANGCLHACKDCHNPQTWNPNQGEVWTKELEDHLMERLSSPYLHGLTLSGGDPLHPQNREAVLSLCQRVKRDLPRKTIWLYTGFLFNDVQQFIPELLPFIDVMVDGKFETTKFSPALKWKGSSNQRIIDIQASLKSGEVVELFY